MLLHSASSTWHTSPYLSLPSFIIVEHVALLFIYFSSSYHYFYNFIGHNACFFIIIFVSLWHYMCYI